MSDPAVPQTAVDTAPPASAETVRLVLVTGMSGAGRSTALKTLEDIGYEAVDNLPLSLLIALPGSRAAPTTAMPPQPLAVGVDVRSRNFSAESLLSDIKELMRDQDVSVRLLFLDCDDDILERRYTETRRRHPLALDRPVADGIRLERERLSRLRERADMVVDTTQLKPNDLKLVVRSQFGLSKKSGLSIFVTSFSFRAGLPREADLVFDVRFLDNPHYDGTLRPFSGLDAAVGAFIARDRIFPSFWDNLTSLIGPLLPRYDREGKSYLTIAIGCTGGRHRSVYVAEQLAKWLTDRGESVVVVHRDIERRRPEDPVSSRGAAQAPAA